MKTSKYFFLLPAAILLVLMSCAGQNSGPITIEWWQFWTDPSIRPTLEKMVSEYESQNPGIKINMTDLTWGNGHEKIVVAFSSGTAPDVVELGSDWVYEFASSGQLMPLTKYLNKDTSGFYGWPPAIYNNEIYAMPWILGTRVLFINRTLLTQAMKDSNFVPVNFDQLKTLCYKIDSLGNGIKGFGSNAAEKHTLYKKFLPFFWSFGGRIISRDGKFAVISSQQGYDALKYYKSLSDSCSLVDTQRRLEDAFLAGKVGMIISGDWLLKRIKNEKINIDFITALIPGPVYPGKSFVGGEYLSLSAKSAHSEEAVKFIRYITDRENQLTFCQANYSANPSSKEATQDKFFNDDPNLQVFIKEMNLSPFPAPDPQWVYIEDVIESMLEDVLFKGVPVADGLYTARSKIQQLIDNK
ncbi:Extracellular solute-binding protein family 1 [Candidatus Zixiibacteriota bacterium]|nr:Extracellular solute-binding protein family 1 [candidate division Zixibacteria bacterium]